jgi:lantibiotic modifying enzyme
VVLALVRLAELLDEPGYLTAARMRARRMAGVPFLTLDLMDGTAGAVVALTRLAATTGDPAILSQALEAGETLLSARRAPAGGRPGCFWQVAMPAPGLPSFPYLGLAHGAAGIGLALAELAAATGEARFAEGAARATDLLLAEASPSRDGGLIWPRNVGERPAAFQAWCHGAAGIGLFFSRLSRIIPDSRYREAAEGAARSTAAALDARTSAGLCHGLAGDGGFLLDMYKATGDESFLGGARRAAHRLDGFAVAASPGWYRDEHRGGRLPGLLRGSAGIGSFLLRLGNPDGAGGDLVLS